MKPTRSRRNPADFLQVPVIGVTVSDQKNRKLETYTEPVEIQKSVKSFFS